MSKARLYTPDLSLPDDDAKSKEALSACRPSRMRCRLGEWMFGCQEDWLRKLLLRVITDNAGVWAFHCHVSWHLEAGLMM